MPTVAPALATTTAPRPRWPAAGSRPAGSTASGAGYRQSWSLAPSPAPWPARVCRPGRPRAGGRVWPAGRGAVPAAASGSPRPRRATRRHRDGPTRRGGRHGPGHRGKPRHRVPGRRRRRLPAGHRPAAATGPRDRAARARPGRTARPAIERQGQPSAAAVQPPAATRSAPASPPSAAPPHCHGTLAGQRPGRHRRGPGRRTGVRRTRRRDARSHAGRRPGRRGESRRCLGEPSWNRLRMADDSHPSGPYGRLTARRNLLSPMAQGFRRNNVVHSGHRSVIRGR